MFESSSSERRCDRSASAPAPGPRRDAAMLNCLSLRRALVLPLLPPLLFSPPLSLSFISLPGAAL